MHHSKIPLKELPKYRRSSSYPDIRNQISEVKAHEHSIVTNRKYNSSQKLA